MSVRILGSRSLPANLKTMTAARRDGPPALVRRREIAYWQERGWVHEGNTYRGNYQTKFGAFAGLVEERWWGDLRFYMLDPPPAVRSSRHWACFQPRRGKGYLVHMARRPADVSSGIMTIERLITEAFESRG